MKRHEIIKEIWRYGMDFPNFPINELEEHLKNKTKSIDDINFGLAYVQRYYVKNQDLDEYLIDQDSISHYISFQQKRTAFWSFLISVIALIVAVLTLVFAVVEKNGVSRNANNVQSEFPVYDKKPATNIDDSGNCIPNRLHLPSANEPEHMIHLNGCKFLEIYKKDS